MVNWKTLAVVAVVGALCFTAGYVEFSEASGGAPSWSSPSPIDGASGESNEVTLAVDISDPEGDVVTVTFYDASDDSVIGTDTVTNGTAEAVWRVEPDTTQQWYISADDGTSNSTSSTWEFTVDDWNLVGMFLLDGGTGSLPVQLHLKSGSGTDDPANNTIYLDGNSKSFPDDIRLTYWPYTVDNLSYSNDYRVPQWYEHNTSSDCWLWFSTTSQDIERYFLWSNMESSWQYDDGNNTFWEYYDHTRWDFTDNFDESSWTGDESGNTVEYHTHYMNFTDIDVGRPLRYISQFSGYNLVDFDTHHQTGFGICGPDHNTKEPDESLFFVLEDDENSGDADMYFRAVTSDGVIDSTTSDTDFDPDTLEDYYLSVQFANDGTSNTLFNLRRYDSASGITHMVNQTLSVYPESNHSIFYWSREQDVSVYLDRFSWIDSGEYQSYIKHGLGEASDKQWLLESYEVCVGKYVEPEPTISYSGGLNYEPQVDAISPADGAENQPRDVTVSVDVSDPDGDSVTATIYKYAGGSDWDAINTSSGVNFTASAEFTDLSKDTEYLWKVTLNDGIYNITYPSTGGYSFTTGTPPNKPTAVAPTDGATEVTIGPKLEWNCSHPDDLDLTYDIYLGTSPSPSLQESGLSGTLWDAGVLAFNSTYYWQVVVTDTHGLQNTSDVFSFTTEVEGDFTVFDEEPYNGTENVDPNPRLFAKVWQKQGMTMNITFSFLNEDGDWTDIAIYDNVTNGSFSAYPSQMDVGGETYYWRVSADAGSLSGSEVFHFSVRYVEYNYNITLRWECNQSVATGLDFSENTYTLQTYFDGYTTTQELSSSSVNLTYTEKVELFSLNAEVYEYETIWRNESFEIADPSIDKYCELGYYADDGSIEVKQYNGTGWTTVPSENWTYLDSSHTVHVEHGAFDDGNASGNTTTLVNIHYSYQEEVATNNFYRRYVPGSNRDIDMYLPCSMKNLALYTFELYDLTGRFSSPDSYLEIYDYNESGEYVVTSDYWSSEGVVNTYLVFNQRYYARVVDTPSSYDSGHIEADSKQEKYVEVSGPSIDTESVIGGDVEIATALDNESETLQIIYDDTSLLTEYVNVSIVESYVGGNDTYVFNGTFYASYFTKLLPVNASRTYHIWYTVHRRDRSVTIKETVSYHPGMVSPSNVDAIITHHFGSLTVNGNTLSWVSVILLAAGFIGIFILPAPYAGVGIMVSSAFVGFLNIFVFNTVLQTVLCMFIFIVGLIVAFNQHRGVS